MKCNDCKARFIETSCGELTAVELADVEAHLRDCDACSAAYAKLLQMHALLDSVEQPSVDLAFRFRQRLAQEAAQTAGKPVLAKKYWPGVVAALWPARPAWAFAYSVLLLSCGLVSGQLLPPDSFGFQADASSAGRAGGPENADISPEQLVQMCAVQSRQAPDIL